MQVDRHAVVEWDSREKFSHLELIGGGSDLFMTVLDGHPLDKYLGVFEAVSIGDRRIAGKGVRSGINDDLPQHDCIDGCRDQEQGIAFWVELRGMLIPRRPAWALRRG